MTKEELAIGLTPAEKHRFRIEAAKHDMSMSEMGREIIGRWLELKSDSTAPPTSPSEPVVTGATGGNGSTDGGRELPSQSESRPAPGPVPVADVGFDITDRDGT